MLILKNETISISQAYLQIPYIVNATYILVYFNQDCHSQNCLTVSRRRFTRIFYYPTSIHLKITRKAISRTEPVFKNSYKVAGPGFSKAATGGVL